MWIGLTWSRRRREAWRKVWERLDALLERTWTRTWSSPRVNTKRHTFRPSIDGNLEVRVLLSQLPASFFLNHPQPGFAYKANNPKFRNGNSAKPFPVAPVPRGPAIKTEVARGGQSVVIATPDGSHFIVQITQYIPATTSTTSSPLNQNPIQGTVPGNPTGTVSVSTTGGSAVQAPGTIRAYAMSGGRVGLIVDGSNNQTELTISPYPMHKRKGYAHSFSYGLTGESGILNIGQITVNSGSIAAISGYHTTDLSGPITISGANPVDRIALDHVLPGASITTGGDLNTLDILNGADFSGSGTGISVGRDLNLMNVGGSLTFENGANLTVDRYLGETPQPAKGTGTGSNILSVNQSLLGTGTSAVVPSVNAYIQGSFTLGSGSVLSAPGGIANSTLNPLQTSITSASIFLIEGTFTATSTSQVQIPNIVAATTIGADGGTANFVAQGGFNIPGT